MEKVDYTKKIQQILWGKSFANVSDGENEEHTFILRSLSIKETNLLNFIYDQELENAINNGILTLDQFKRLFEEEGILDANIDDKRKQLEREKIILQNKIKNSEFATLRKRNLEKQIKDVEKKIKQIQDEENQLFAVCAENRAEEFRRRYMVWMFSETVKEEPYWNSIEDFMQSTDEILLTNLILAYFKNNLYKEEQLRAIARHPEWRFRWVASKSGADLFGRSVAEWSEMQNMLVYWSEYYDSIYESMEKPPEYIIENDQACDAWVRDQNKKYNQEKMAQNKQSNKNHAERFIMVQRNDQEAIKKVQDLNPTSVREQLKKEYEQIKKSNKRIKEWDLGDRRNNTKVNVVSKGRKR